MGTDKKETHIFDICGTLYKSNTTYDFLKFYLKNHNTLKYLLFISLFSLPAKVVWKLFYFFKKDKLIRAIFINFFKNEPVNKIEQSAVLFVEKILPGKKIEQVHRLLEKSRAKSNAEIWLVSASVTPVVKAIASKLNVKNFLASELEIKKGTFTGQILRDLESRKDIILDERSVFNNDVHSYTDSRKDELLVKRSVAAYIVCKKEQMGYWRNVVEKSETEVNFIEC